MTPVSCPADLQPSSPLPQIVTVASGRLPCLLDFPGLPIHFSLLSSDRGAIYLFIDVKYVGGSDQARL